MDEPLPITQPRPRRRPRPERPAAIAGILVAVAFAARAAVGAIGAGSADSADGVASAFAAHPAVARAIFALLLVSIILFALFLGGIMGFLAPIDARSRALTMFAFSVCTACLAVLAIYLGIQAALANPMAANEGLRLAIFDIGDDVEAAADIVLAAMAIAGGLMVLRARGLPRWLGRLGIVGGGVYGVGVFSDADPSAGILDIAELVGVALFILWIVLTSIAMLRRTRVDGE